MHCTLDNIILQRGHNCELSLFLHLDEISIIY